jgi:hypothetical protein
MTINGSEVTGTFTVGDGSNDQTRRNSTYKFRGKPMGTSLRIAFAGKKKPDVSPSEIKSLIWTLVHVRGKESLRIHLSGKNYQANKDEVHFAYFESCGANASGADSRYGGLTYAAMASRLLIDCAANAGSTWESIADDSFRVAKK